MRKHGIIELPKSDWITPIVSVEKRRHKSLRLCVDYMQLNAASVVDAYPMPC